MRLRLAIAVLSVLLPATLCAQFPRGPRPWWDGQLAKDLGLNDAQTKQIRQTQDDFRPRMSQLRTGVNKAESAVDAAFNEDPVDQAKANDAINQLAAARAELTRAVSQMDLKLRTILTAAQWQQLKQRQRSWPDRPGGPGRHRGAPTGATSTPSVPNPQK
jgi:Spy/CpxP family protein refolding chaperone